MNCKRAKSLIGLWVGHDLEEGAVASLRVHIQHCPTCREHFERLNSSRHVLRATCCDGKHTCKTVWPEVSAKISGREEIWSRSRFNGWVPASTLAVACLLLVAVALQPPVYQQSFEPVGLMNSRGAQVMVGDDFGLARPNPYQMHYRPDDWDDSPLLKERPTRTYYSRTRGLQPIGY